MELLPNTGTGFLPWAGSAVSDAFLLFEIALGLTLLAGMLLVRAGHVRAHMYVQSLVVLVNIPLVLVWMVPQYLAVVAPALPGQLGVEANAVPTLMLGLGVAAEALGVYIILVAATGWLPERLRFRRYKLVMRVELGLWWTVLLLGLSTYYLWYVPH